MSDAEQDIEQIRHASRVMGSAMASIFFAMVADGMKASDALSVTVAYAHGLGRAGSGKQSPDVLPGDEWKAD